MSAQAIIYRLRELDILSVKESGALFDLFAASGWKKIEPHSLEKERLTGLKRNVYHALSEGLISRHFGLRSDVKSSLRTARDKHCVLAR